MSRRWIPNKRVRIFNDLVKPIANILSIKKISFFDFVQLSFENKQKLLWSLKPSDCLMVTRGYQELIDNNFIQNWEPYGNM
jgi:hypothetical protein